MPDSDPGNDGVETDVAVTCMVNCAAVLVEPTPLTTCLITVSWGATSRLVITQVLSLPAARVTLPVASQSPVMPTCT